MHQPFPFVESGPVVQGTLGLPRRADEFPWSQDWHAPISLPLLSPRCETLLPSQPPSSWLQWEADGEKSFPGGRFRCRGDFSKQL